MSSNFRSRRIVLEKAKEQPQRMTDHRRLINPNKFPHSRVILRKEKKEEQDLEKVENIQAREYSKENENQQQHLQHIDQIPPIMHSKIQADEEKYTPEDFLEARDRRTLVRYDFQDKKYSLDKERIRLSEWLGEMHFKVVSSSFNLYITNELTFEEVKVHCCENLLLNILTFLEQLTKAQSGKKADDSLGSSFKYRFKVEPLGHLQLTSVLKQINETIVKNLAYMQIKYPLTKDTKPNKALQSLIYKINNLGNDEHDMVMKSGINFTVKKEDNYTAEIMKFLNFIITKQSEPCKVKGRQNKQLTYFEFFYQTMETIFTSIYKPEYEEAKEGKQIQHNQYADAVTLFANIMSQKQINQETQEVLTKQAKEYKEKVLKYTHYRIGRKISPNTELYSDKEIQTQIFDIRNSSVLRILTKWTEELQNKIIECEENILKRPFRFKKNKPYEYSKLNANQKNDLYQETKRKAKDVKVFNEELQENYNEIESMIISHIEQSDEMKNIPKKEYKVGYFCSKIQVAASSTLLSYLNKMIHILLLIPEELKKNHMLDEQYVENMDINLITFKIADLFRCKIKSREAEIIRIFKKIKQISEKGEPFKIVRIKDRLNLGTRDILINILFMNMFLCEIQLAVQEYVDAKQVSYDSFSHFLYELHRSRLGPIMESACTWAQFDQRSKIFRNLSIEKYKEMCKFYPHYCNKDFIVPNRYPFVCSLCQRFYSTEKGLLKHVKCNLCRNFFECTECIYSKLAPQQIASLVKLPQKLGPFINEFQLWHYEDTNIINFPKFGLLTSKNVKRPDIIFFQTIIFKYDAYIIKSIDDENHKDKCRLEIVEKIVGNTSKNWRSISQKYIIYEWKQKRAFNKTITPQVMLLAMEEEKREREKAAKTKKEEKEKKRQELEAKRKQRQKDSDSENQKGEGQQKQKKKKGRKLSESESVTSKNATQKQITNVVKPVTYHETISKKSNNHKMRVIERQTEAAKDILVLGIYLKESMIRNKLKEMSNNGILQKITLQKIEVLFFEDEYIHNELNEAQNMTEAERQELKQTIERVNEVYLDNNFIEDIKFLSIMTSLKVAHLSNNLIKSIQPLENLKCLTQLVMENNDVQDLTGLKNKPQIVQINLNRNKLSSLSFFSSCEEGEFPHLKHLYLSGNEVTDLNGLQKLPSLVKLDLSYNMLENVGQVKTLVSLEQLDLSNNKIKSLKGIQSFCNLKKLYLNDNKLKRISRHINDLIWLNVLEMANNKIKRIEHLNTGAISKNLKILKLSENKISVMQELDGLENLRILNLSHNEIQRIDNYLDLVNLVKLDLSHNCIQEIDLEDAEKYLPCLKELYLNSNPLLSNQSNKSVIASLSKHLSQIKVTLTAYETDIE